MTQAMQPLVFVDGNNVMGSRADGWWRDRTVAANAIEDDVGIHIIRHKIPSGTPNCNTPCSTV